MPSSIAPYQKTLTPAVPRPWKDLVSDKSTRISTWLMGAIDCSSGPNPKMTVNGYNTFTPSPNSRASLYIATDQTMSGSSLYDSGRACLKIEGNNTLSDSTKEYAVYTGGAKDIDGSGKIDVAWTVKVWFDGFVESRVVVHPINGASYKIVLMWVEIKFKHDDLKWMRAPYGGGASGAFKATSARGFGYDESLYADPAKIVTTNPTWAVKPHDFVTYDVSYGNANMPAALHLWMGNPLSNVATGGSPTTFYAGPGYRQKGQTASGWEVGFPDSEGGLQKPWFMWGSCGTGVANSSTDKGFWFGLESDANHRTGLTKYGVNAQTPKVHMYFQDGTDGIATIMIDFMGSTGSDKTATSLADNFTTGRYPNAEATTKPLTFEYFWHSVPCKPRNSVDWQHFRPTNRWTIEASNYGAGGAFGGQVPSGAGHTKLSTRPMSHLMDNQFDWMRNGTLIPSRAFFDTYVVTGSANPIYKAWADLYRNPASDTGGYMMPNLTLLTAIIAQSSTPGLWPPDVGTYQDWRRYPLTPFMDPETAWKISRFDLGILRADTAIYGPNFGDGGTSTGTTSTTVTQTGKTWTTNQWKNATVTIAGQTRTIVSNTATVLTVSSAFSPTPGATTAYVISPNIGCWIDIDWGHPDARAYIVSEVAHCLENYPEIVSIYYDNCELARNDHPDLPPRKTINKDTLDFGATTSNGAAKIDRTTSGATYTKNVGDIVTIRANENMSFQSHVDAWGNAISVWPLREYRKTMLELYRTHERFGKFVVGHSFGDLTPPIHSFCHYVVHGEELVGILGCGAETSNRPLGVSAYTATNTPYSVRVPAYYWNGCWMVGSAPLFLPEFNRQTGVPGVASYRSLAHNSTRWSDLLSTLNTYEVQLFLSDFVLPSGNNWAAGTTYAVDDYVISGGTVYLCKLGHVAATPANVPPNATYWFDAGSNASSPSTVQAWWDQAGTWRA